MNAAELEQQIVAAHQSATSHRVAMLFAIAAFDRLRLHERLGFASTARWLSWKLEIAPETAREHVRVARALDTLPLIADALRAGVVSFARIRAITRKADTSTQQEWLALASRMSAPDLERHIRDLRNRELTEDPDAQAEERYLRTKIGQDGMLIIDAKAPTIKGALINAALRAAAKQVGVSTETDQTLRGMPLSDRRRLDALVEISRHYLAGSKQAHRSSDFSVLVHYDASEGTARIADGPVLSRKTLVEILQTARVGVTIATPDGQIHAGEVTRRLPRRLRREILLRDQYCQYPGCRNDVHIDVHHKTHRSNGGENTRQNLVALCSYHHRFIHRSKAQLEQDQHGTTNIRLNDGTLITPRGQQTTRKEEAAATG